MCVIIHPNTAQPTNLNVDGSRLFWSGTSCSGSSMIYEITVNGPQTIVFNVTSVTTTPLGDLEPNQMYTVSVRAFGSSCSTQAAGTSFVASGNDGPATDGEFVYCGYRNCYLSCYILYGMYY